MPVTLAHPAAVLPLRGLGLPLSALVVGSMVPDLPVLAQTWGLYGFSHGAAGIVTLDLALTLLLLAFWDLLGRDALVDTAPAVVRDRLPARARIGRRAWLLAPLAAVLGSTTHTVWDAFTHQGRWGVRHVAWLRETHGGLPGQQWAQFASGIVGLLVVGLAIAHHVRRLRRGAPRPRRLPAATLPVGLGVATAISLAGGVRHLDAGLHAAAFHAAVAGILALAGLVGFLGVVWRLVPDVSDRVGA
ncbi:DUF4184 family protein [Nocardioides nitrophenolicus]|uniref:DUF4184 family protein n=1 Tax=Nocardioides nitrophenolicus TaxID=60489 RepID=UPI0019597548|nr:DUF4184 family protein [Nocardioides nitrophenolicus]MBM7517742.1 hypothetical protein [Nocardioides nitrophenolicus]